MKASIFLFLTSVSISLRQGLFAQDDMSVPPPDQSFWQTLVMIGIAFMFFYVILWRPEQKRRQALEEQRSKLKKGDRVVATGIIGTVVQIGEQTVILKMYDGTKLEFNKYAITDVLSDSEEDQKKNGSVDDSSSKKKSE